MVSLALVRQFEAVGFRAWPATSVSYDATWAIRMTAAHPSKRLNSVNPLDPGDTCDIPARVERAVQLFRNVGRAAVFRQSPLAPPELEDYLEGLGWQRRDESIVMTTDLAMFDQTGFHLSPEEDIERFVDASSAVHQRPADLRSGYCELLGTIRPSKGMFVLEDGGKAVSSALCVHDGLMAGLLDVGTALGNRRHGHAHRVVGSALNWAAQLGAKTAWLQIEATNIAGIGLYEGFGFQEAYRYAYRESKSE